MTDLKLGTELFFGVVGATGTDMTVVVEELQKALLTVEYGLEELHLSELIEEHNSGNGAVVAPKRSEDQRIAFLMTAGTELRESVERSDAVALLGIAKIRELREAASPDNNPEEIIPRQAYVFRSLKNPGEVESLREVYGDAFHLISVYVPKDARRESLVKRFNDTSGGLVTRLTGKNRKSLTCKANALIERDEDEQGTTLGQNVQDVFPLADLFVTPSDYDRTKRSLGEQIQRYIDLLFGARFKTPTIDEFGINQSRIIALRTADVARQVGAAIMSDKGDLLTLGCNEVPAFNGGHHWEGVTPPEDNRDFTTGQDHSVVWKNEIITEVFERLKESKWLSDEKQALDAEELTRVALQDTTDEPILKKTRVASLLEFGRIIHAEMSAIVDAARRGISVNEATLYCTTFPCHMCTRHIIGSGIRRVVYVEPYPKSLAGELYEGTIQIDPHSPDDSTKVRFEPFVGIAPRKYIQFFEGLPRKDGVTGQVFDEKYRDEFPRVGPDWPLYFDLENTYLEHLEQGESV